MRAVEDNLSGGGGGGSLAGIGSKPIANPFMSNWGPVASATDQLYVPGFSDPRQGIFSQSSQAPAPLVNNSPAPAKQPTAVGSTAAGLPNHFYGSGGVFSYLADKRQSREDNLYNSFLHGIMTPSQLATYNGNPGLVQGRQ